MGLALIAFIWVMLTLMRYTFLGQSTVLQIEEMYNPGEVQTAERARQDLMMFGVYIQ